MSNKAFLTDKSFYHLPSYLSL